MYGFRKTRSYGASVALEYPHPPLVDDAVVLRAWTPADLPVVEEASLDPYIPRTTTVPALYTPAAGRAWIERQRGRAEQEEGLSLAIVDGAAGAAVGAIVLMHRGAGVARLGYWLVEGARGRGLETRAVRLLAPCALSQSGLARVEA